MTGLNALAIMAVPSMAHAKDVQISSTNPVEVKSLGDAIRFAGDRCAGAKVSDIVPLKAGQTFVCADGNGNTLSIIVPELPHGGCGRQDHLDRDQDREGPCRP
jgi:hypothetical protein